MGLIKKKRRKKNLQSAQKRTWGEITLTQGKEKKDASRGGDPTQNPLLMEVFPCEWEGRGNRHGAEDGKGRDLDPGASSRGN